MRLRLALVVLVFAGLSEAQSTWETKLRTTIEKLLGRPYVWGATGDKSFDCSGFVWRVASDQGLYFKRTTARKLWFSTTPVQGGEKGRFGNLVFFDDLRHIGIVNDGHSFYHAQSSIGTNLSQMTAHWRRLMTGEHKFFVPDNK